MNACRLQISEMGISDTHGHAESHFLGLAEKSIADVESDRFIISYLKYLNYAVSAGSALPQQACLRLQNMQTVEIWMQQQVGSGYPW